MIEEYLSEKHKKRKKRKKQSTLLLVLVTLVLAMVAVLWIMFRSPLFRVRHVAVQGNDAVPSGDVIALVDASILKNHDLFKSLLGIDDMLIWPDALASSEVAMIPQLSAVTVTKNYLTSTATITATERQPFGIWCDMPMTDANGNPEGQESCYWFDATGMMFARAFDTEGSAILSVHDYSDDDAAVGQEILPAFFIPNLISILDVVKTSDLNIEEVALNDLGLQEIDVTTYNGPAVYFSLRFSAAVDLPVLQSLMTQPNFDKLQYVDFRVQNRAYYK